jgi:hypothetical protein
MLVEGGQKQANIERASQRICQAAETGAKIHSLARGTDAGLDRPIGQNRI